MKHLKISAIATVMVVSLAVAAGICWVFMFPYDEARLWRALPPNAEVVSIHRGLADRWPVLLRNPVMDAWLAAAGFESGGSALRVDTNGVDTVMAMLKGGPAMTAWTPALGRHSRPAWVGVAWAGGHAQLMRWGWLDRVFADFEVVRRADGRRIWVQPQPAFGTAQTLALAIHEGILLAVLSDDAEAIDVALERIVRGSRDHTPLLPPPRDLDADDVLMWAVPRHRFGFFRGGRVTVALSDLSANSIRLDVTARQSGLPFLPPPAPQALQVLPELLGTMPSLLLVGSVASFATIAPLGRTAGADVFAEALAQQVDGDMAVFLALSGHDYGGTLMRLSVPGFWIGLAVADADQAARLVQSALDGINARLGAGLVAEPVGPHAHLQVLTPVGETFYARLARHERAAYAVTNGWVIASSSLAALQRVLDDPRAAADSPPAWAKGDGHAAALLWVDCVAAANLVRQALAAFTLAQLMRGGGAQRYDTPRVLALLDGLAALNRMGIRIETKSDEWRIALSMGACLTDETECHEQPSTR